MSTVNIRHLRPDWSNSSFLESSLSSLKCVANPVYPFLRTLLLSLWGSWLTGKGLRRRVGPWCGGNGSYAVTLLSPRASARRSVEGGRRAPGAQTNRPDQCTGVKPTLSQSLPWLSLRGNPFVDFTCVPPDFSNRLSETRYFYKKFEFLFFYFYFLWFDFL